MQRLTTPTQYVDVHRVRVVQLCFCYLIVPDSLFHSLSLSRMCTKSHICLLMISTVFSFSSYGSLSLLLVNFAFEAAASKKITTQTKKRDCIQLNCSR